MSIKVTMTGNKELERKFKKLEGAMQYSVLKDAFEDGAVPIKEDARTRISLSRTLKLYKSIEIKSKSVKGGIETSVGTNVYYASWVEKGHPLLVHGKFVKVLPPAPFLTPAFDSRHGEAMSIIEANLERSVLKAAG